MDSMGWREGWRDGGSSTVLMGLLAVTGGMRDKEARRRKRIWRGEVRGVSGDGEGREF